jgi:aspartokinase/homoserine dehydrogenase 1
VDRSGYVLRPEGLSGDDLDAAIFAKENGRTLASLGNAQKGDANAAIEHALTYRFVRPVVIDVTDDPKMASPLGRARLAGADLITANKGPIADSADDYRTLMSPGPCITRAEATVGAGLPILNTLGMLVSTGDTLERIEGSLSGTLGFVLDQMNDDISLSDAVKTAVERGYTEPDPCVDLSGSDVLRKAIILSRMAGWDIPAENISLDGFVPGLTPGKDKAGLLEELMAHDQAYQSRLEAARRHSACLRYVASVTPDRIIVGLEEVPGDHPLSGLRGTDNMVVFTSQRYAERPLVVMGPGAGPQVTAMGVFGDLVRIAGERAVKRG